MRLFRGPAVGFEISPIGIRAVVLGGRRSLPVLERFVSVPYRTEIIRSSHREQNVLDPAAFVAAVREAYDGLSTRQRRISLSIPDQAGRVFLLDLDAPFKTKREGVDLIRWKLKKSFPFPIQDAHIDFEFVAEKETGELTVLVSCIALNIVHQYEDLLIEAGIQPYQINFAAFNIFRLFATRFAMGERKTYASWFGGMLSLYVFSEGKVFFCRSKEIHGNRMDVNRIYREINSSLLVYRDKNPGLVLEEVYCVSTLEDSEAFVPLVGEVTGLEPITLDISKAIQLGEAKPDRLTLVNLAAATGAAMRSL